MTQKPDTKSPLRNLPVHLPGQSVNTRLLDVLLDGFLSYWLLFGMLTVIAMMEWLDWFLKLPPAPILFTVLAVIAGIVALVKTRSALREAGQLKLGRIGEEAVGQYLEEKLRPQGCQVLHDIPGEGFNVDHVVIGPTGIFCIETKTHSKPAKGASSVQYDGEKVTVDGMTPDRDPIVQAKAAARWLSDLVLQSTGRRFPVQPAVLYPGWFVEKAPPGVDVWVLNEKAVPVFIGNARGTMSSEDISLVTFHLKRYVIAKDEEGKE
ncbi:MAG: nuclease-related domain-containing protein [Chloroflexi bacterium]|nr:nuclease-related domain-containing protein [Chloroflexota bacterium]